MFIFFLTFDLSNPHFLSYKQKGVLDKSSTYIIKHLQMNQACPLFSNNRELDEMVGLMNQASTLRINDFRTPLEQAPGLCEDILKTGIHSQVGCRGQQEGNNPGEGLSSQVLNLFLS